MNANLIRDKGFWALYTGRMLFVLSGSFLGIFLPIFLYNFFDKNIYPVLIFYTLGHLVYGLLVPIGAKFLNKFGFKNAIVTSVIWGALFWTSLTFAQIFREDGDGLIFIFLSFLFLTLFRLTYWIPYHIDFVKLSDPHHRSKQLGVVFATITLLGAVGPIVGGYIIELYGFTELFIAVTVIFLFALIPFRALPRTNEKFTWTYAQTWKHLLSKENRSVVMSQVASGAESTVGIVIWPIFIFLLLDGNYFEVGLLSSAILLITVFFQISVGNKLDHLKTKKHFLKISSISYALGWIMKIFVITSFHIFIAGLYHTLTKIFSQTSFDSLMYDIAADQGHYIDEFTAIREMAINLGKFATLIVVGIIVSIFSIQWTFIIAAIAAISLNIVYAQNEHPNIHLR